VDMTTCRYREKTLLHCWIDCFLSGTGLALVGQCKYTAAGDGSDGEGAPAAHLVKLRPTEPREMYRTARDHKLWDWNNCVHFGAAALRSVAHTHARSSGLSTTVSALASRVDPTLQLDLGGCTSAQLARPERRTKLSVWVRASTPYGIGQPSASCTWSGIDTTGVAARGVARAPFHRRA
jgi:hypothetical protein